MRSLEPRLAQCWTIDTLWLLQDKLGAYPISQPEVPKRMETSLETPEKNEMHFKNRFIACQLNY
jgi:hypothetical protein